MTQTQWGKVKTKDFDLTGYKKRLKDQCDLQFGPEYDWTDKENITYDVNLIINRMKDDIRAFAKHCGAPVKVTAIFYSKICVHYLSVMVKKRHDQVLKELNKKTEWGRKESGATIIAETFSTEKGE